MKQDRVVSFEPNPAIHYILSEFFLRLWADSKFSKDAITITGVNNDSHTLTLNLP